MAAEAEPEDYAALLEDAGLTLQAEQAARRSDPDKPADNRTAMTRRRLRLARAAAHVALPADGMDEFVLLVARREVGGTLAVLEALLGADSLVEAALRKLGAPSCPSLDEAA